jgi:hypothetical protein
VHTLEKAIDRRTEIREVTTTEEAVRARFPNGAPPMLAAALTEGYTLMRADTVGRRTDAVRRLIGREPRDFEDWCHRHAGEFASLH